MGRAKAQRLYYNVLVNRLRGNSDFYDMARQMLAEAKGLRGIGFFYQRRRVHRHRGLRGRRAGPSRPRL